MFNCFLTVNDKSRDIPISEAAVYSLLCLLIIFLGIAFLIAVVWLVGKIISKSGTATENKETQKNVVLPVPETPNTEEIDEETVAVIMAALMAYYEKINPKCEFTVRRIKKLK